MTREKGLETILVFVLITLFLKTTYNANWLIYVAFGLLAIGILSKRITIILGKAWFSFSHYFGAIMNYIIMFIIFFLVLTPLSFFQRLTGKNQILKKETSPTNFKERNHTFTKKDIDKPW